MPLHHVPGSFRADQPGPDDGDWPAYEALVRDHYTRLCACAARYVGPGAGAEDVVQDVLLRVWAQRNRLGDVNLLAYIIQSIHNAAVSALRRDRSDAARGERLAAEAAIGELSAPLDTVERSEIAHAVATAIDSLPERCRLIFLMHRDGGLTYREIADRLGLSVKTVETQMGRALKALRERLAPLLCIALCLVESTAKRLLG